MYKFKVVVCDDEDIIRTGVSKFISKTFPNVTITGVYSDGSEVIDHLKHYNVDIIISDIKMRKMSGLDVTGFIKDNHLETAIILMTGFQDFEYAKQALKLHAHALITKPVDFSELIELIEEYMKKALQQINSAISDTAQTLVHRESIRQNLIALFHAELPFSTFKLQLNSIDQYLLDLPCVLFEFSTNSSQEFIDDANFNYKHKWKDLGDIENENIISYYLIGDAFGAIFLVFFANANTQLCKAKANDFIDNITHDFKIFHSTTLSYSQKYLDNVSNLSPSSENHFFDLYCEHVLNYDRAERLNLLTQIIETCSYYQIFNIIKLMCQWIEKTYNIDSSNISQLLVYSSKISDVIAVLEKLDEHIDTNCLPVQTPIVSAVEYINEHYNSFISLKTLSQKFGLSDSHFSRQFKKELGKNFKDYLIDVRLKKAKEFLKTGKYIIKEVSSMVGYDNPLYFGQIFKNHFGITPYNYMVTALANRREKK